MPKVRTTDSKGLVQSAGAGLSIGGALVLERQTVAAAGGNQGAATAIAGSTPLVIVTGATGTEGVRLPAVAGLQSGQTFLIQNAAGGAMEVYPATGDRIYPAADNAGITVAAYGFLQVTVLDATGWVGNEGVIGA